MHRQLLFIPGPVMVADRVLAASASPMIDHRGPEFAKLSARITERMKPIFGTRNDVMLLGASGTGGLEAAVATVFRSGERLLAAPIGVFGQRLIAIAKNCGCIVDVIETPNGSSVDPQALHAKLEADTGHGYAGILLTHNETSTGVQNNMAALSEITRAHGAIVIVDAVSGLGASDFRMDEWGFDVVITASQKAIAAPPGVAMVAVSERAWAKAAAPGSIAFSHDLRRAREFAGAGQTPWTPPVGVLFAVDVALEMFENETAQAVWSRHARYARAIRTAMTALGLEIFSREGAHSVTVVAVRAPEGVDVSRFRAKLREERGIVLGGGQGAMKGQIFRMGTMGSLSETDVLGAIGAIEIALLELGVSITVGAGVQAALRVFLDEAGLMPGGASKQFAAV